MRSSHIAAQSIPTIVLYATSYVGFLGFSDVQCQARHATEFSLTVCRHVFTHEHVYTQSLSHFESNRRLSELSKTIHHTCCTQPATAFHLHTMYALPSCQTMFVKEGTVHQLDTKQAAIMQTTPCARDRPGVKGLHEIMLKDMVVRTAWLMANLSNSIT